MLLQSTKEDSKVELNHKFIAIRKCRKGSRNVTFKTFAKIQILKSDPFFFKWLLKGVLYNERETIMENK